MKTRNALAAKFDVRLLSAAAIAASSLTASADVSSTVVDIVATNASGSAHFQVAVTEGAWTASQRRLRVLRSSPVQLVDPSNSAVVATINSLDMSLRNCSQIDFLLVADAGSSDTTFEIQLAGLDFAEIASADAQGRAVCAMTVQDRNSNGALLSALGAPGTGMFFSRFNDDSQVFANLLASVSAGAGGTASGNQKDPPAGYRAVGSAVHQMTCDMALRVSFGDRATISTQYDMNPDPVNCPEDADGDGMPDWLDGCPNDPAKNSPGACGCGAADSDADGDGVLDCDDNCPSHANSDQSDADSDGVGDACEASDPVDPPANDPADPQDDQGGVDGSLTDPQDEPKNPEQPEDAPIKNDGLENHGEDGLVDGGDLEGGGSATGNAANVVAGEQADGVDELINNLAPVASGGCGAGMVGMIPLMLAGLCGVRSRPGGARRQ